MSYEEITRSIFNVPNLLLISLMLLAFWVFSRAQSQPTFEIGDMLRDDSGKPSSSRFAVLVSLGLSSYLVAYAVINKSLDNTSTLYMFYAYIITWSSSKALEKFIEAWSNKGRPSVSSEVDKPKEGA